MIEPAGWDDWFDFNPSMGMGDVEQFKSSFGAVPYACRAVRRTSMVEKMLGTAGNWARKSGERQRLQ